MKIQFYEIYLSVLLFLVINCMFDMFSLSIWYQAIRYHTSYLEHNQVVVMPLNLEDVRQSCDSCFEIW